MWILRSSDFSGDAVGTSLATRKWYNLWNINYLPRNSIIRINQLEINNDSNTLYHETLAHKLAEHYIQNLQRAKR